ncbi:TetR/AcrR family transcriptional regulator [Actinocorallia populi]|uniref:TetR/AcrR family transcriptional regulator n=1 Tax=Actinocorallia populi TaxID=2079200 RepID=UPI000D095791|nr:TetR/AcrR family transcriptional regulator [Actinocorallia populi]
MDGTGEDERVLAAALRLFAGLGYDGTTTEMIAAAAGIPPSSIAGGKSALYQKIFENFHRAQMDLLEEVEAVHAAGGDLHQTLDMMMDFYLDHRQELTVWQYRGLSDAVDVADIDERFRLPVTWRLFEAVGSLEDLSDPDLWISAFSWCLTGFINGGIVSRDPGPTTADDLMARRRFRALLHDLTDAWIRSSTERSSER